MPEASKPKVPYCGFGAAGTTTGATGAASATTDGDGGAFVAQATNAVEDNASTTTRTINSLPNQEKSRRKTALGWAPGLPPSIDDRPCEHYEQMELKALALASARASLDATVLHLWHQRAMSSPAVDEIRSDPEWIPHAFEEDNRTLTWVFVPQADRKELVFLSDGRFRGNYRKVSLPIDPSMAVAVAGEAPLNFIFNTSFCCSTLLANALSVEGVATNISEPNILVNLAERVIRTGLQSNKQKLELALSLLSRPLQGAQSVVVKPSSFANVLIEPILEALPASRAVLLYSEPKTFLSSVARRGLLGRVNARRLYSNLIAWTSLRFGFSAAETFEQSDLQVAALAWLMQIAHFDQVATRLGPQRVMVLDAADLLAGPEAELERVQSFFGLGLRDDQIREIVSGPAFTKHSKGSVIDYDATSRARDHEAVMQLHADELGMVIHWLNAVAAHLGVPLRPLSPS
jgi:hypothetical protein